VPAVVEKVARGGIVPPATAANQCEGPELSRIHELAILANRGVFRRRNNKSDDRRKLIQYYAASIVLDAENIALKLASVRSEMSNLLPSILVIVNALNGLALSSARKWWSNGAN
jgi:hypothetical protein